MCLPHPGVNAKTSRSLIPASSADNAVFYLSILIHFNHKSCDRLTSLICPIRARLFPGVLTDLVLSFRQLAQMIEGNYSFSDLLDVGKDLQNILNPKVDKIYAGDIYTTISIMKVLNREANRTMYTNISNEDLTRFLEVRALSS